MYLLHPAILLPQTFSPHQSRTTSYSAFTIPNCNAPTMSRNAASRPNPPHIHLKIAHTPPPLHLKLLPSLSTSTASRTSTSVTMISTGHRHCPPTPPLPFSSPSTTLSLPPKTSTPHSPSPLRRDATKPPRHRVEDFLDITNLQNRPNSPSETAKTSPPLPLHLLLAKATIKKVSLSIPLHTNRLPNRTAHSKTPPRTHGVIISRHGSHDPGCATMAGIIGARTRQKATATKLAREGAMA